MTKTEITSSDSGSIKKFKYVDPIQLASIDRLAKAKASGKADWGGGGGFSYGQMLPPKNLQVNYAGIQQSLNNIGLSCSENNIDNIKKMTNEIHDSAPTQGLNMRLSTPSTEAVPDQDWTIVDTAKWADKMRILLVNHQLIEDKGWFLVTKKNGSRDYNQSTSVAIKDLFKAVAEVVGDLVAGHVNVDQLTKHISTEVEGLGTQTSSTYELHSKNTYTFFASELPGEDVNTASCIAGAIYQYNLKIEDYKNKKSSTHKAHYDVSQWSMMFSDANVFNLVYSEVVKATS